MPAPHRLPALIFILTFCQLAGSAHAQSPYADEQSRSIKALSTTQIDDYRNGRGMGLAKSAELNDYPGPRHVLDLSEQLELEPNQINASTSIFESMQKSAQSLGAQLVEKERELDQLFVSRRIDDTQLKQLLNEIAEISGQLRYTHLQAHLQQTALLSDTQVQRYNVLRGYDSSGNTAIPASNGHHSHAHGH